MFSVILLNTSRYTINLNAPILCYKRCSFLNLKKADFLCGFMHIFLNLKEKNMRKYLHMSFIIQLVSQEHVPFAGFRIKFQYYFFLFTYFFSIFYLDFIFLLKCYRQKTYASYIHFKYQVVSCCIFQCIYEIKLSRDRNCMSCMYCAVHATYDLDDVLDVKLLQIFLNAHLKKFLNHLVSMLQCT